MSSIEGAPVAQRASDTPPAPHPDVRTGVFAALAAYSLWGFLPPFFKLLEGVDPLMVVANRVAFSLALVLGLVMVRGALPEVRAAFRNRKVVLAMLASTVLIAINWLTFVWGVSEARVLEVSFGYFINPLVSVAIGLVFLGERFSRLQVLAVAIALLAVAIQAVGLGAMPWVAMVLALSFGIYGYVRKVAAVNSTAGLFVETLFLLPPALLYIGWQVASADAAGLYADPAMAGLLMLTGPLTAIPLMLFAFAARQLRLSTIGMFQYIAPSMHFLFAVFVFGEPLNTARLVSFALIWISLALFSGSSFMRARAVQPPSAQRTR